jgi:hypothetical protein
MVCFSLHRIYELSVTFIVENYSFVHDFNIMYDFWDFIHKIQGKNKQILSETYIRNLLLE